MLNKKTAFKLEKNILLKENKDGKQTHNDQIRCFQD